MTSLNVWVGLCCLFIVAKGAYTASVRPRDNVMEHNFDLGPLRCCPRPRDSEVCPNLADNLPCPYVNADEMDSRESNIRQRLQRLPGITSNCSDAVREFWCGHHFPTCLINPDDGSHEVQLPARDTCIEQLNVCPDVEVREHYQNYVCRFYPDYTTNYSIDSCTVMEDTLSHCTVDWYSPEWLQPYLVEIDRQLIDERKTLNNHTVDDNCWRDFRDFRCKSLGRCWAQGDRLEYINSLQECQEATRW